MTKIKVSVSFEDVETYFFRKDSLGVNVEIDKKLLEKANK